MMIVYRYQLPVEPGPFRLALPQEYEFLHMGKHQDRPCMWALIDLEAPVMMYEFAMYGTGDNISDIQKLDYMGTVILSPFVAHYFRSFK